MATEEPISVALLHGQQLLRHALARLLAELPGYALLLRLADGAELKRAVATGASPQLLVVELAAAEADGGALLYWCNTQLPHCHVLVLGCPQEPHALAALLLAGAHGSCCAEEGVEGLRLRLDILRAGGLHFPPTVLVGLRSRVPPPRPRVKLDKPLTTRQREYLCLVVRGDALTHEAMAAHMNVSVYAVLKHRRNLGKLFGVTRRQGLAEVARELGLG